MLQRSGLKGTDKQQAVREVSHAMTKSEDAPPAGAAAPSGSLARSLPSRLEARPSGLIVPQ